MPPVLSLLAVLLLLLLLLLLLFESHLPLVEAVVDQMETEGHQ